ncbi:hypothetical protein TNCV_2826241 [Trichonephila clavipes]|nr:hypothetical protein TNCV_2826241 [Trichonephila clavipes]
MSSSLVPLKTLRAEGSMLAKYVEVQTSSRWRGVVSWRVDSISSVLLVTLQWFKSLTSVAISSRVTLDC